MRKRAVTLLLAGILAAQTLLFGACGAAGTGAEQTNVEETDAAKAKAPADDCAAREGLETESQTTEDGGSPDNSDSPGNDGEGGTESDTAVRHADGANGFAFRFTKEMLLKKAEGENLIVSPYSVWLPLAALANGTSEEAKEQLLNALGSSGMDLDALNEAVKNEIGALTLEEQVAWMKENGQEDYEGPLKIANALFVDQDFQTNQEFEKIFSEIYDGRLFSVDFADASAVGTVNDWAKEQTDGKIDQVVESFDPQTVAAIANAIYYSDGWAKEFPKENTKNDVFYGNAGEEDVPFMYNKFTEMPYYEDDTMQAASLGTSTGGRLTILLPREGQSAEEILAGFDAAKFETLMETDEATVELSLPKFKVESDVFSVKEALEELGIPLMSSVTPHLDKIVDGELLYISQAVQKAMIEVDEEGMTAAAVTLMAMERMSLPVEQEPVEMKCDRPFAFIVSAYGSEGQQVLFAGVVNQIGK